MSSIKPYEGDESYIFVSYSHKDEERVYPLIEKLQRENCRIWYDVGIDPGEEWPEVIARHLNLCTSFIAFISEESLLSHNCRREISYAVMKQKPMLVVFLEEVKLSPGMEMQMASVQAIFTYRQRKKEIWEEILKCSFLKDCMSKITKTKIKRQFYLNRKFTSEKILISRNEYKIGRKKGLCDYAIDDNKTVSKVHAIFRIDDQRCVVIDNYSTNKIYINDKEIPVNQPVELKSGDLIEMGSEKFVIEIEEEVVDEY